MRSLSCLLFFAGTTLAQVTHNVSVTNFAYSPNPLTVNIGDTIRWTGVSGLHTITSGLNSMPSSRPGALFDASVAPPQFFTHLVTTCGQNGNGVIPYFCRPHEGFMSGTINVNPILSHVGLPRVGGVVTFTLNVPTEANRAYVMAGSFGSQPGLSVTAGRIIPLNLDPLLLISLGQNNPTFSGFIGTLTLTGQAIPNPFVAIPAINGLIGQQWFFASVTVNPTAPGQLGSISNSDSFTIQA